MKIWKCKVAIIQDQFLGNQFRIMIFFLSRINWVFVWRLFYRVESCTTNRKKFHNEVGRVKKFYISHESSPKVIGAWNQKDLFIFTVQIKFPSWPHVDFRSAAGNFFIKIIDFFPFRLSIRYANKKCFPFLSLSLSLSLSYSLGTRLCCCSTKKGKKKFFLLFTHFLFLFIY